MKITLAPDQESTVSQEGAFCYFKSGDGPIEVELRNADGSVMVSETIEPGQGIPVTGRFFRVRVINRHTTTQTVDLFIYSTALLDNRAVVSGTVKLQPRESFTALPMMTATGTIAANPARAQLELMADPANTGLIWLGGVANEGFPLKNGGTYQVAMTGALDVLFTVGGDKLYIAEVG